jgi:septal ring factor EnvC (AmiA/AmiB activator)
MDKKIKFIIIGLMAILTISLFFNLQLNATKNNIERERNNLKNENELLNKKIETALVDNQLLNGQVNTLNTDLERISREKQGLQNEKDDIQKKYDALVKEREEFLAKYKDRFEKLGKEETKEPGLVKEDTYWAGILKAKTDLGFQLEKIRNELKMAQVKNEELMREKGILGSDLKNMAGEKQALEQQLEYNQKSTDSVASELALEKNTKRQLRDYLKLVKNENALLRRQVKSLSSNKVSLEEKFVKLQEEKSNLERRFNEMASLLEDRLSNIGELKQQLGAIGSSENVPDMSGPKREYIELPPIVVRPQSEISPQKTLVLPAATAGKILSVDKDNNFVVIDLGTETGIKIGDTLQVYRGDRVIATIEIIQARRDIAACDIKKEYLPIIAGDTVR